MTNQHQPTPANDDAPAPQPVDHGTTEAQDAQKEPKDPSTNPSPPGDNVPDPDDARRAEEVLERVKPY